MFTYRQWGFCLVVCTLVNAPTARAEDWPRVMLDNVRASEALYADLDVAMRTHYELAPDVDLVKAVSGKAAEIVAKDYSTRYVNQGDRFRVDIKGDTVGADNESHTCDRIKAYDGLKTRLFEQRAIGNIIDGYSGDVNCVRPHMLLLSSQHQFPLSTFLGGHEAILAAPGPGRRWNPNEKLTITYEGGVEFQGLQCHKVLVSGAKANDGKWLYRWELWLAEDRNYIPLRVLGYIRRFSATVPISEALVSEWYELSPGIWFPKKGEYLGWDKITVKQESRHKLRWRETYDVEQVSLIPSYDDNYFAEVSFPDGTPVYEVGNRKVTKSYLVGAPTPPKDLLPDTIRRWWPLWGNLAVLICIIGTILWRRRPPRST